MLSSNYAFFVKISSIRIESHVLVRMCFTCFAVMSSLGLFIAPAESFGQTCGIGVDYALNGLSPTDITAHSPYGYRLTPTTKAEHSGCQFENAQCVISIYACKNGVCGPEPGTGDCWINNRYESGQVIGYYGTNNCPSGVYAKEGPPATPDGIESAMLKDIQTYNSDPIHIANHETLRLGDIKCYPLTQTQFPEVRVPNSPEPQQSCSNRSSAGGTVAGSVIECRDGIVHQEKAIVGTPYSLQYSSRESDGGSSANRSMKLSIKDFSLAGYKFKKVTFTTTIYGKPYTRVYPLDTVQLSLDMDISQLVSWDGKDASGNVVYGPVIARTYALYDVERLDAPGVVVTFRTNYTTIFDNNTDGNRFKLNGWTLSHYHRFEPSTNTIYAGFGLRIPVDDKNASPTWRRDASNNYYIPSQDTKEVYKFSSQGLHLQTIDSILNVPLFTFQHDAQNRLASVTDRYGLITTIQRDTSGNVTSITSPGSEITSFTIDASGYIASIKDPSGSTTKFTYGTGSAAGLMLSYTNPANSIKYYTYDSAGRLTQSKDFRGATHTFSQVYDIDGKSKATVTTPLGRATTFESYLDPNMTAYYTTNFPEAVSVDTTISSDGLSRQTYHRNFGETSLSEFVPDARFPARSSFSRLTETQVDGQQDITTRIQSFVLQTAGDPLSVLSATQTVTRGSLGDFKTTFDKATLTYTSTSPSGRTVKTIVNAKGDPASVTVGNLSPIQYTYNARGNLTKITQGTRSTTIAYNAKDLPTSVTNALGEIQKYTYNANRLPLTTTFPNAKSLALTYNANGAASKVTLPGLQAYSYTLDKKDFITKTTEPVVGTSTYAWVYQYSLDDERTKTTHPDTTLLNYEYNAAGQLSRLSGPFLDRYYNYNGSQLSYVTTASSGDTVNYGWNGSRPTAVSWTGSAINGSVEYSWGSFQRLTEMKINGQPFATFAYTPEGEISNVKGMSVTRIASTGLISQTKLGTVTTKFTYNSFGEVTGQSALLGTTTFSSVTYTRDALGRITAIARTEGGLTTTKKYTYDTQGALLTETVGTTTVGSYTYDANGNRFSTGGNETYDSQDRLSSDVNWTYTYNRNGFLIKKTHKTNGKVIDFAYDNLGNLLQVRNSSGSTVDYTVDGLDRRIVKKVSGAFVDGYLYQDSLRPAAQLNEDGSIRALFVYGTRFNSPDIIIKGGVSYRVVHDHVGSPIYVINTSNSSVAQKITYDAWGNVLSDSNPGFQPFGFAGGLYDSATGLVRFGARDYDPSIGRWLNKDPIRFEGGWNLYAYVSNDPVNSIDPLGLADLNLYPPKEFKYYEKVPSSRSYYSVGAHGNPNQILNGATGELMDPEDLARWIEADPNFNRRPVKLDSCRTGQPGYDGTSFAQRLANRIKVPVIAPTNEILIQNGKVFFGKDNPGKWIIFKPNK